MVALRHVRPLPGTVVLSPVSSCPISGSAHLCNRGFAPVGREVPSGFLVVEVSPWWQQEGPGGSRFSVCCPCFCADTGHRDHGCHGMMIPGHSMVVRVRAAVEPHTRESTGVSVCVGGRSLWGDPGAGGTLTSPPRSRPVPRG